MLQRLFHNTVRAFFTCFILLTLLAAVSFRAAGYATLPPEGLFVFILALAAVFMYVFSRWFRLTANKVFANSLHFFARRIRLITMIMFACMIAWQLLLIHQLAAEVGSDIGSAFAIANYPEGKDVAASYLSIFPNNNFLVFVMYICLKFIRLFTDRNLWAFLDVINLVAIDSALIILALFAKRMFGSRAGYATLWVGIALIGFSPWVLIPYTDTLSLPLVSAALLMLSFLLKSSVKNNKQPTLKKIILGLLLGFFISCAYLLKPSSIVIFFALGIATAVWCLKPDWAKIKTLVSSALAVILSAVIVVGGFSVIEKRHPLYAVVDESKAVPMTHFIMMGMTGSGGYNGEDYYATIARETKQEKTAFHIAVIKERLKEYGIPGYTTFLFQKHTNNTADGTFAWDANGQVFLAQSDRTGALHEFLDSIIRREGSRAGLYRFFAQWIWIGVCVLMLISVRKKGFMMSVLRLGLIGGLLFLLIFEGGRSRYLIQFFPQIILMSGIGLEIVFRFLRKKYPIEKEIDQT